MRRYEWFVSFLFVALLTAMVMYGCSMSERIISPPKPHAQGTPMEDDGGGGGGGPAPALISVPTAGTVSATGTLTIPISIAGFVPPAGSGAKGFQVTVLLSSGLRLSPNLSAVTPGTYITGSTCGNDAGPIFSATYNADSTVTIVAALNPGKCSTCASGIVFNVKVTPKASHSGAQYVGLVASPVGAVTASPTLKDCAANADQPVGYGNAVDNITIQ